MKRLAVLNVVGLTQSLLGPHSPHLNAYIQRGALSHIEPAFPAVTCTAQANYLTGLLPAQHGIVANGWYHRELAEVHFWKQSNHLVQGKKLWELLREKTPHFTCSQLFWWFNMYSSADWSITPRPLYPADGRKIFDIYTWPYSIRPAIKRELGEFPFPAFWGPAAGLDTPQGPADAVTRWIAESARWMESKYHPTLNLVYLPHLDYSLQRLGPDHPAIPGEVQRLDAIVGDLIHFFESQSVPVALLSEYGIEAVDTPIHLNRLFREKGWLVVKEELGRELLDYGASRVFAVADHQIAHIYCNDPLLENSIRALLEKQKGIAEIWGAAEKQAGGLDHSRSGDLIAIAQDRHWFTYYYWMEDHCAPDFARTVDIHRKPGFDPVELFLDPKTTWIKGKIAWRLLQKKLGFRMLMDVVPLDASLVKGSHGRRTNRMQDWPLFITPQSFPRHEKVIHSTRVSKVLQDSLRMD